jgi:hypothetical protein
MSSSVTYDSLLQAVFFPAGAWALPAGNPKTSQEILSKAADKRLSSGKMIHLSNLILVSLVKS